MRVGICVAGLCRAKEASISAASGALKDMAERTGLEPATPGVTGRHSNQLTLLTFFYL